MGFDAGGFVAAGDGGGGSSITVRVGTGVGRAGFLRVLEFSFVFALTLGSTLGCSAGEGDTSALAFGFAAGFVTPPAGIPASLWPVAGDAASTGWLLGSAAKVDPGWSPAGD